MNYVFPDLKIINNDHKTCDGLEIDVCIPELNLAIEWNGILHREPIYGFIKFASIKKNDKMKKKLLLKMNWSIIIVNDYDSKKPLQYSKKVCTFISGLINKNKIKPKTIYELEVGMK